MNVVGFYGQCVEGMAPPTGSFSCSSFFEHYLARRLIDAVFLLWLYVRGDIL